jgi:hypothetical protein
LLGEIRCRKDFCCVFHGAILRSTL